MSGNCTYLEGEINFQLFSPISYLQIVEIYNRHSDT